MNEIGDNDNLGYIVGIRSLINATPDSEKFRFSACDKNHMIDCLCKRLVVCMYMRNKSSDIVLDACIRSYDGDQSG